MRLAQDARKSAPALSPPCREALQGHELLGSDTEGQDWDK
jgi:hypothetical protein